MHLQHNLVTLPAHALLRVLSEPSESTFVEVEWERRHVLLFRTDLRQRGQKLDADAN